jgi:hypothetical protein
VIAIAAVGAALLNTVEHSIEPLPADVRWLLVGSVTVAVASIAALIRTLKARRVHVALYRTVAGALAGSALAVAAVGLTDLGSRGTLVAMVLLLCLPIAAGLSVWVRQMNAADLKLE